MSTPELGHKPEEPRSPEPSLVGPILLAFGSLATVLALYAFATQYDWSGPKNAAPQPEKVDPLASAIEERSASVAEHPEDPGLRYELALLQLQAGDADAAHRNLDEAAQLARDQHATELLERITRTQEQARDPSVFTGSD